MAHRFTPEVFSSDWRRRLTQRSLAASLGLLLLPVLTTLGSGSRGAISTRPQAPRPVSPSGAITQQANDAQALEPGRPIERELAGGESHSYQFMLGAGQYLRAVVVQQGVNVIVTLFGPDDKKIADFDSPVGLQGPEPVSLIAEISGRYRLEVRPWQQSAPKGRYNARIEEVRAATPQDKTRVAAEWAFAEATLLTSQGTVESLRKAIDKFETLIPVWQSLEDRRQEAYTLTAIGHFHRRLGDYRKALDYHEKALSLKRAAGDRGGAALSLYNLGAIHDNLGEPQQALVLYNQALSINRALGDQSMEAATLGNIGVIYSGLGDQQKALDYFKQALPLKRGVSDHSGEAILLNNIGLIHSYLGEKQQALEFYSQSLPIHRSLGDRPMEATTLNNMGSIYDDLGEYQKALDLYDQVVQIKRAAGNPTEEAIVLSNIGVVYGKLGQSRKALEFYNQALSLSRGAHARSTEATTLGNIGKAYSDLGEAQKAIDYHNQALLIHRDVGDRRSQATALTNIGRAYHDLGERQKALGFFNQALPLRRAVGDRGGEAVTRYNIARVQRDLDQLAEARAQIDATLEIVEALRSKVARQGLRTSYLATVKKFYELGVDILMQLHRRRPSEGFAAAALQTSERARARTLLDLLAEARVDIRQGVSPDLLERERALQRLLDVKATAQMRLLSGKPTPEQISAAAKELDALTAEHEQIHAQIRLASPRYAALTQPTPLSLKEIQTEALDDDTLLLDYALGEEKSYLWAVTPSSIDSFELPKRAEIETAARRVYELLTARNQDTPNETPEQRRLRVMKADAQYPPAAAALSRMLLDPVASRLKAKRLLIVGEGMLQYTPFAALPGPGVGDRRPLIVEHEIITLPSASALALLRRETAGRKPAAKTIAVLADPVFQSDDPRVASAAGSRPAASPKTPSLTDAQRSAAESGLDDFVRLRFSRQEADEITRLASGDQRLEALDFAASRATALSPDLAQYRIVHFATHGLINNLHPELSGLVLSLVDEQGRPQNGFLRLYEIYNLKLGADLVVLSACQTALGKEFKGEGMVGLTRGFMYAGAPRVAASLWRIEDRATAELMKRFYRGVLAEKLRPAAALRAAQVSMWKDQRWRAPNYWASFIFQGEWE